MTLFSQLALYWQLGHRIGSANIKGTRFAIGSVVLGAALLSSALAVVAGYEQTLRTHLLKLESHLELVSQYGFIQDWPNLVEVLREEPEINNVTPFFVFSAAIRAPEGLIPIQLRAVDTHLSAYWSSIESYLTEGDGDTLPENGLVLGATLANDIGVAVGDSVKLLLIIANRKGNRRPSWRHFRVAALFDSGTYADRFTGIARFASGIRLAGAQLGEAGGIDIRVNNPLNMNTLHRNLQSRFYSEGVRVSSWESRHSTLFATVQLSKRMLMVLLLSIVIIAGFNVTGTLLIALEQRRYELARMLIMGATSKLLVRAMLIRGLWLGAIGGSLGIGIGIALASCANGLVDFLKRCCEIQLLSTEVYFLNQLPAAITLADALTVLGSAIAVCALASVYPAWRVAQLRPVHAMAGRTPG